MRIVAMDGAPLPSSSAYPIANELKRLHETLLDFESRAAKWSQISPKLMTEIGQSLKPSLEQLEQTWQAVADDWNAHVQDHNTTLYLLQETLQEFQKKPDPRDSRRADRYPPYPISSYPSFWSRIWNYLNEPAIQVPPKSKRPESFN